MKKVLCFGIAVLAILVIGACKKNPCKNKTITSADFTIYERLDDFASSESNYKYRKLNNIDTVFTTSITFSASDTSQDIISYRWQIGLDSRVFTKKEFTLEFRDTGWVDIKLIVTKNVDKECFPSDDGIDSTFQRIYVTNKTRVSGYFEGYRTSNPTEKFTIHVGFTPPDFVNTAGLAVLNLPMGCDRKGTSNLPDELYYVGLFHNFQDFSFGEANIQRTGTPSEVACQFPFGNGSIDKYGNIVMDFQIWVPQQNKFIKDRFIGVKK